MEQSRERLQYCQSELAQEEMTMRSERARRWVAEWAGWADVALGWVAFSCAVFLLLGIAMPGWLARTTWESGDRNGRSMVFDSPAGFVGLVSLCGTIAFVALAIGVWKRRWVVAAMLAAATAFAFAAYVSGSYWLGLSRGVALLEGHYPMDSNWTVHWPPALPVFVFAAIGGAISALAVALYWRRPRSIS